MASPENTSRTLSAQGPSLEPHHILQHGLPPTERQSSGSSTASSSPRALKAKSTAAEYLHTDRPKAYSSSSRNTQSSSDTRNFLPRDVRTLPRKLASIQHGIRSLTYGQHGLIRSKTARIQKPNLRIDYYRRRPEPILPSIIMLLHTLREEYHRMDMWMFMTMLPTAWLRRKRIQGSSAAIENL